MKSASKEEKKSIGIFQASSSRWLLACLLSLCTVKGGQVLGSSVIWTPTDILTQFAVSGNGYLIKNADNKLAFAYDKHPAVQFSVGAYHSDRLGYLMVESKNAFSHSNLQLYSAGVGARIGDNYQWLPFKMLGAYLFLDTTFKEAETLWDMVNLCNLNIGVEGELAKQYHLILNTYIPLRSYLYSGKEFSIRPPEDKQDKENYIIGQTYYLESGNYAMDVNLRKTFFWGKFTTYVNIGGYCYYEKAEESGAMGSKRKYPFVVGGTHKLAVQWNNVLSLHYKLAYDTAARPFSASLGAEWKHSTHSPTHTRHQHLWAPSLERHLSPLFASEATSKLAKKSEANTVWVEQRCKAIYQDETYQFRDPQTLEPQTLKIYDIIKTVSDGFLRVPKESLLECILELECGNPKRVRHIKGRINLATHPDKFPPEKRKEAEVRHIAFRDNILPTLYKRTLQ